MSRDLDFARDPARLTPPALLLAVAAAAALAWTGLGAWRTLHALQGLDAANAAAAAAAPAPGARAARSGAGERRAEALRSERELAERLARPWLELLDRIEAAAVPRVPLVRLHVEPTFREARLELRAMTLAELFEAVARLDAAGAPLAAAELAAHEWVGEGAERRIEARIVLRIDPRAAAPGGGPAPPAGARS